MLKKIGNLNINYNIRNNIGKRVSIKIKKLLLSGIPQKEIVEIILDFLLKININPDVISKVINSKLILNKKEEKENINFEKIIAINPIIDDIVNNKELLFTIQDLINKDTAFLKNIIIGYMNYNYIQNNNLKKEESKDGRKYR